MKAQAARIGPTVWEEEGAYPDGKHVEDTDHDVLQLWISSKHCKFL